MIIFLGCPRKKFFSKSLSCNYAVKCAQSFNRIFNDTPSIVIFGKLAIKKFPKVYYPKVKSLQKFIIYWKPFHIELNCVGILKLKNSTVEANLGPTYFTPRSTRVRLCFMVILKDDETDRQIFLQELSLPISCSK